jgi:hypothetical protein
MCVCVCVCVRVCVCVYAATGNKSRDVILCACVTHEKRTEGESVRDAPMPNGSSGSMESARPVSSSPCRDGALNPPLDRTAKRSAVGYKCIMSGKPERRFHTTMRGIHSVHERLARTHECVCVCVCVCVCLCARVSPAGLPRAPTLVDTSENGSSSRSGSAKGS